MSFDRDALSARIRGKTDKEALPIIAEAMARVTSDSDLKYLSGLIDIILKTGMPEEDPELVGSWEASRRNR